MIVLGLGSNCGDRKGQLRGALRELSRLGIEIQHISPVYESDAQLLPNAPDAWNLPFLNIAVACRSSLSPRALLDLIKGVETKIGRKQRERWAPREIDIDILCWDNLVEQSSPLSIPHPHLWERPFAALPLADVYPHWKDPREAQSPTAREKVRSLWPSISYRPFGTHRSNLGLTEIAAILNLTPDSFSDGGKLLSEWAIVEQARAALEAGATLLDLGAESTRPQATPTGAEEEWSRLEPALKTLRIHFPQALLSVDTRHAVTAERALNNGAQWINDVSGCDDPNMIAVLKKYPSARIVVMHHVGIPPTSQTLDVTQDPIPTLLQWGQNKLQQLESQDIERRRILFDPGIGFGKTPEQSFEILSRISELRAWGVEIFVGHSRKSFLRHIGASDAPSERDEETALVSTHMSDVNVDFIRVHDVPGNALALKTFHGIQTASQW